MGSSIAFIFVPLITELIESISESEGINPEENTKLNDKASGMFNLVYGIGSLVAPIIGGILN